MIFVDLEPMGLQKSFYGKAKYSFYEKEYFLKSYDTIVCKMTLNRTLVRLWDGYSDTTLRHVNAFCRKCGLPKISKKDWMSMQVERM